jgi:Cytochrome b subunit of formate dehydrogenase
MVAVALQSGLAMGEESRSGLVLGVHVGAVVMIGVGLIVAALFGNHRDLFGAARQLVVFDGRDVAWLRSRLQHPFRRHTDRAWGMFNTGQKILAWCLAISLSAVIVTGVLDWSAGGEGGGLHGPVVVVTALLLGAHIFMAVVNPATRPALAGMVFGRVRRSWAAEHHGEWLDKVGR